MKHITLSIVALVVHFYAYSMDTCVVNSRYKNIYRDILDAAQINPKKIHLVCLNTVTNAAYDTIDGMHYVEYNNLHFDSCQPVAFCGAICHELGHYLNGHLGVSNRNREKQADIYAGYLMRKLNFERFENAYEFILKSSLDTSDIYDSFEERIKHIEIGWDSAKNEETIYRYSSFNPRVVWKRWKDTLRVSIDDIVTTTIKDDNDWDEIYFDPTTFGIYQLFDCCGKYKYVDSGLGRLITNKSRITFRLTTDHSFIVYYNQKEIPVDKCLHDTPAYTRNNNLVIKCYNDDYKNYIEYVLKDYTFAPTHYLLTAYIKHL